MLIKKIIQLCKSSGQIRIINTPERQYISDGYAVYPLDRFPRFTEDNICTAYDIPQKQADKLLIQTLNELPHGISFDDVDDSENLCEDTGVRLGASGNLMLVTTQGIKFFPLEYLAPLSDTHDLEIYERPIGADEIYFVVKSGFMIIAVVFPASTQLTLPDAERIESAAKLYKKTIDSGK